MTVVEYINRIRHMNNELSFKQRQREELLDVLTSITAPQGEAIQKTADDKMSRLISQYVDLGEEIVELYRRKFAAETELLSLTRQLPPQWEEFVLLRYCRKAEKKISRYILCFCRIVMKALWESWREG